MSRLEGGKMKVVPIHAGTCKESIAVLQHLLAEAHSGKLLGLAICAYVSGQEEITFTGMYRKHPARGVNASLRMSVRLAQLQDDLEAAAR